MAGIINCVLFVITLTILTGTHGQDITVVKAVVQPGETLEFTCHIAEYKQGELIYWQKIIQDKDPAHFGTNNFVADEHKGTPIEDQFTFKFEALDDGQFDIKLNISDVTKADSGSYSCSNPQSGKETRVEVSVLSDPETIALFVDDTPAKHVPETEYDLNEEHNVKCVVEGSYPEPTIVLMVGNSIITSSFEVTNELVVTPGDNEVQPVLSYKATAEATPLVFDSRFAGRKSELKCMASLDGSATKPIESDSFKPKFKGYPPVITCPEDEIISYLHEPNVIINCTVDAQPAIDMAQVSYRTRALDGDNGTVVTINAGESESHYTFETKEGDGPTQLILKINRMYAQTFREHFFVVSNSMGEVEKGVLIKRDKTKEVVDSGSPHLYASISMSITCAILAALHL